LKIILKLLLSNFIPLSIRIYLLLITELNMFFFLYLPLQFIEDLKYVSLCLHEENQLITSKVIGDCEGKKILFSSKDNYPEGRLPPYIKVLKAFFFFLITYLNIFIAIFLYYSIIYLNIFINIFFIYLIIYLII